MYISIISTVWLCVSTGSEGPEETVRMCTPTLINAFSAVCLKQGLKALEFVSLDADMAVASTPCHYLEDERAHIPHFQQVWIHDLYIH